MAEFKAGDRVRIVEHDDVTREPKPGGREFPATVIRVMGAYVYAKPDESETFLGKSVQFWADSGWTAWARRFSFRLLPVTGEEAGAPGRDGELTDERE